MNLIAGKKQNQSGVVATATLDTQAKAVMPQVAEQAKAPMTVFGHHLRVDDKGRLCLTDMHKAAHGKETQSTFYWLRQTDTMTFVAKVAEKENLTANQVLSKVQGRNGGTFAHWQIALAYAKYLSPELHMEVNKTYMRYKSGDHTLAIEVIDKQTDPNKLADIEVRARSKRNYIGLDGRTLEGSGREATRWSPRRRVDS